MPYSEGVAAAGEPVIEVKVADRTPYQYNFKTGEVSRPGRPNSASNDMSASSSSSSWTHQFSHSLFDVGIFKDTLAPSLTLHSGLAVIAYGIGRYTDRVETKDYLWPSSMVINAWWSAVGRFVILEGRPLGTALKVLSWPERLLLSGVTLWGGRLLYRVASRSLPRGTDDPRYGSLKKEEGFWNKALITTYLPEAVATAIIALPFTAPFRHGGVVLMGYHPYVQAAAVGLFSAGLGLEVFADYQLQQHKDAGNTGMLTEGVWSIVRHPNYLGDALAHLSFPILLYGSNILAPIELLGPIANYVYSRYIGGLAAKEHSQEQRYEKEDPAKAAQLAAYEREKNAFWPDPKEVQNQWTWAVVGCAALGTVVALGFRTWHLN